MSKKIIRLLCLVLCLAMAMTTLSSCKKSDDKKKKNSKKPETSSVVAPDDSSDIIDQGDANEELDPDDIGDDGLFDDQGNIVVERPNTSGLISTGIKMAMSEEDTDLEDPDLEGGSDENIDIEEDIDDIEHNFKALNPAVGKAVKGKKRVIKVNNSSAGILFEDFTGISTNVFPTQSTLFSQRTEGTAEAFLEMNGKRFNDTAPRFARSWFQIDWIVTNEAGDDYKKYADDWDSNPDYKNYMNNIYCFSKGQTLTDELYSAIDYYKMLEEAGTEIYLAFGWKIGTRVQDWFGNEPTRRNIAAPRDLEKYAQAAAALFKYMRNEVGLTNFNSLSFYNEPDTAESFSYQGSWDYVTIGDKCIYWVEMARECKKEFAKHKDIDDVLIYGPDSSRKLSNTSDNLVNAYIAKYAPDCVDAYTLHFYGYSQDGSDEIFYEDFFNECVFAYNFYVNKPIYITEYYNHEKDILEGSGGDSSTYYWSDEIGWSGSSASLYIAVANTGLKGAFKWAMVGGRLIEPTSFFVGEGETASWYHPRSVESINKVKLAFYQESLLNNYVLKNSNVHEIKWEGDDIRCAAFTTKNQKDFSLVVEANEKSVEKTLDIELQKSLGGKTVYVYYFNHNWVKDGNALIPQCQDTISKVSKNFSYNINGEYGLYVFSTIKPVKQVALFDKNNEPAAGVLLGVDEEITISSQLIDCSASDKIKWEITAYDAAPLFDKDGNELKREDCIKTGTYTAKGKLTDNGDGTFTYKSTSQASAKDVVAIRGTIIDGDKNVNNDRYAVCTIIIA